MMAIYVVWRIEEACPNCTGALTEIGLQDGCTTQECRSCIWSAWWRPDPDGVTSDPNQQDDTGSADGHAAGP